MTFEQTLANVSGRIATLAGFYGIDLGPMSNALGELALDIVRRAMVTVPHTFDRMAISTRLRPELIGPTATPQLARAARFGAAEARDLDLELESIPSGGYATTVRAIGPRKLESDLTALASFGVDAFALDQLRTACTMLGADDVVGISDREVAGDVSFQLHIRQANTDDEACAASRARIDLAATALGATGPQRRVVQSLHDTLAKGRDSMAAVRVGGGQVRMSVRWVDVQWETAIKMMLGFYPRNDAGQKLGELSGAFDAESAAGVELHLGPTEPPGMSVSVVVV